MQRPIRPTLWIGLAMWIVMAMLFSACAGPSAAPSEAVAPAAAPAEIPAAGEAQTLYIATDLDVSGLDPATIYDLNSRVVFLLYEGLVTLKGDTTEIVPDLAESWEISEDGLTYTFRLREGVTFHDGTPLTAEAVKKSFDRFIEIGQTTACLFQGVLNEIVVDDEMTVSFKLSEPFTPFLALMASHAGPLVISPTTLDEQVGSDLAQGYLFDHAVGTGPYKLESWDPGQQTLTLVRNEDYWRGWEGNHVDRVVFRYVVETSTRKLMLEQGEVDIALGLNPDEIQSLEGVGGIQIQTSPTMRIFDVNMNNQNGPLADVKVRQALSYAMDYDGIREFVFNGKLDPLCGPLPSNDPNAMPCEEFPYTLDMEKAKSLLAEAGYPDGGFELEAIVMEGDFAFRRTAEILQAQLAELGITVNLTELAWPAMWERIGALETTADLVPLRNYPDYADSFAMLGSMFSTSAWGASGYNIAYYSNPEFDRLAEEVNLTTDPVARAEMFKQMVKLVVDEAATIYIGTYVNQVAMRDNVKGYLFNPIYTPIINIYDMYKE